MMSNLDVESAPMDSKRESLMELLNAAEANFPPRFREHGWYLTVVLSLAPKNLATY